MERPCLLGPRNEKVEELAPPAGGLSYEQADRPLWQAVDDKSGCPPEMSKDVENVGPFGEARDDGDVGPLGETRDDEDVGPFGETRGGDDGLCEDIDDGEQQKQEEGAVTDVEDKNNLVQLAAQTVSMLSGMLANTGTSTTSSTASSIQPSTSLTSSSRTLSSTPPTTLRKRTRDCEEDLEEGAKDDGSPSQQKRRRMDNALGIERTSSLQRKQRHMDGILGILRKDANAANNTQSIGAATTPDLLVQQSRKRARDFEEDAKDDESLSQQKRRRMDNVLGIERMSSFQQKQKRMDGILGILRKDANAANNAQSIGTATTPDLLVKQSRKRERTSDDDSKESMTRPGPKRARLQLKPPKPVRLHLNPPKPIHLDLKPRGDANDEEAHIADHAPEKDESTVVRQPISSIDVPKPVAVDKVTSVEVHTQASVEEVAFANEETNKRSDAAADDEVTLSQKEWNTAHGINSDGANIRVRGMGVFDLTGEWVHFCLPTSRASSPYRLLTEKEKEDLRTYIQDYGVQDWHVLAECMHSTVRGLKTEYLEYIVARNRQAGRRELAGIHAWPQLAPPPPPPPLPESDK